MMAADDLQNVVNEQTVVAPATKVVTAWAAVGITSWSDVAAALAAVYTLILIVEWAWKKVVKHRAVRKQVA